MYHSTKDIAKAVREQLKKELPQWKFSVTVESYSGGSSITLSVMAGPKQIVEAHHDWQKGRIEYTPDNPFSGYAQLNHYQLLSSLASDQEKRLTNGEYLTPQGWKMLRKAAQILSAEHWDKSDSQVDYFNTNFYRHVQIGKWDKSYEVR